MSAVPHLPHFPVGSLWCGEFFPVWLHLGALRKSTVSHCERKGRSTKGKSGGAAPRRQEPVLSPHQPLVSSSSQPDDVLVGQTLRFCTRDGPCPWWTSCKRPHTRWSLASHRWLLPASSPCLWPAVSPVLGVPRWEKCWYRTDCWRRVCSKLDHAWGLTSLECSYPWNPRMSTAEGVGLDEPVSVCLRRCVLYTSSVYLCGAYIFVVIELMNKFYCFCFCCCDGSRPVPVSGLLPRAPEVTGVGLGGSGKGREGAGPWWQCACPHSPASLSSMGEHCLGLLNTGLVPVTQKDRCTGTSLSSYTLCLLLAWDSLSSRPSPCLRKSHGEEERELTGHKEQEADVGESGVPSLAGRWCILTSSTVRSLRHLWKSASELTFGKLT